MRRQSTLNFNAGKPYDVFLSYRVKPDKELAERLYCHLTDQVVYEEVGGELRGRRLRVFWDKRYIDCWSDAGAPRMEEALCSSLVFVSLLSPQTFADAARLTRGDNVLMEHDMALELSALGRLRIVPVWVAGAAPDFRDMPDVVVAPVRERAAAYLCEGARAAPPRRLCQGPSAAPPAAHGVPSIVQGRTLRQTLSAVAACPGLALRGADDAALRGVAAQLRRAAAEAGGWSESPPPAGAAPGRRLFAEAGPARAADNAGADPRPRRPPSPQLALSPQSLSQPRTESPRSPQSPRSQSPGRTTSPPQSPPSPAPQTRSRSPRAASPKKVDVPRASGLTQTRAGSPRSPARAASPPKSPMSPRSASPRKADADGPSTPKSAARDPRIAKSPPEPAARGPSSPKTAPAGRALLNELARATSPKRSESEPVSRAASDAVARDAGAFKRPESEPVVSKKGASPRGPSRSLYSPTKSWQNRVAAPSSPPRNSGREASPKKAARQAGSPTASRSRS